MVSAGIFAISSSTTATLEGKKMLLINLFWLAVKAAPKKQFQLQQTGVKNVFISPSRWRSCLLHVAFCLHAARSHRLRSSMIGPLVFFVCQIEMEWKPHPLCPVIESNSGKSGFALEIPLNHKIQICLATEKETITERWSLYLLEVVIIKRFPSRRGQRSR